MKTQIQLPSGASIGAAWTALLAGANAILIGLWNAHILLGEKGYNFTVLTHGLFSAISWQKSVRDRDEQDSINDRLRLNRMQGVALDPATPAGARPFQGEFMRGKSGS